jgi:hypothetical protein
MLTLGWSDRQESKPADRRGKPRHACTRAISLHFHSSLNYCLRRARTPQVDTTWNRSSFSLFKVETKLASYVSSAAWSSLIKRRYLLCKHHVDLDENTVARLTEKCTGVALRADRKRERQRRQMLFSDNANSAAVELSTDPCVATTTVTWLGERTDSAGMLQVGRLFTPDYPTELRWLHVVGACTRAVMARAYSSWKDRCILISSRNLDITKKKIER